MRRRVAKKILRQPTRTSESWGTPQQRQAAKKAGDPRGKWAPFRMLTISFKWHIDFSGTHLVSVDQSVNEMARLEDERILAAMEQQISPVEFADNLRDLGLLPDDAVAAYVTDHSVSFDEDSSVVVEQEVPFVRRPPVGAEVSDA